MRLYEIVYIFDATLDEDAVNEKLEKFHPLATGDDGEVIAVDHWGVRQMAYPIQKQKAGYYAVAHISAGPEGLPEFDRILKLEVDLMRYLVVLNDGEPSSGRSILGERPVRPRDDDDDDEDDVRPGPGSAPEPEADDAEGGEEITRRQGPPEFSGGRGRRRRMEGPVIKLLNYKDVSTLSQFMTEQGKILPKRTTKVTARFQRQLGRAIKRARYLSLIPYLRDHEV
jgi:small subunit ribosomal protein S6